MSVGLPGPPARGSTPPGPLRQHRVGPPGPPARGSTPSGSMPLQHVTTPRRDPCGSTSSGRLALRHVTGPRAPDTTPVLLDDLDTLRNLTVSHATGVQEYPLTRPEQPYYRDPDRPLSLCDESLGVVGTDRQGSLTDYSPGVSTRSHLPYVPSATSGTTEMVYSFGAH